MASSIDPTLNGGTTTGVAIQKSELQGAFTTAKSEIEALQAGTSIADEAITNAKLAHMGADTIKGRANGAGTGDATDLTAAQVRTILNVEDGADVTDETNVTAALDGATLSTATVSASDKVLIQDADDSDNLKTVTTQDIADLSTGSSVWTRMLFGT